MKTSTIHFYSDQHDQSAVITVLIEGEVRPLMFYVPDSESVDLTNDLFNELYFFEPKSWPNYQNNITIQGQVFPATHAQIKELVEKLSIFFGLELAEVQDGN